MKKKIKRQEWANDSRPILHMYGSTTTTSLLFLLLLLLQASATRSESAASAQQNSHAASPRFTPSMAIIIVVLIAAFFLMAFFSVYLRLCAGDISGRSASLRRTLTRARRALLRGLDPDVIDSLPTFQYSAVKGLKLGSESLECAVCLNEFEDDENLRLLPKCSHVFHPHCIDSWLVSHTTCPVCRSDLVAADPDTDAAAPAETPDPATEDETRDVVPLHQVAVDVCDDPNQDPQPEPIPIRSKSTRQPLKFPRSHTTGHSLVPPGENVDRFTLRLPENVRKEIVDGRLDRSASHAAAAFGAGGRSGSGGSGRGRFQWRFDRAAKSDRWAFLTAPGFLRSVSVRSQKRADGDQTANVKSVLPSVKTPFDCLGGKAEADAESATVRSSSPRFHVTKYTGREFASDRRVRTPVNRGPPLLNSCSKKCPEENFLFNQTPIETSRVGLQNLVQNDVILMRSERPEEISMTPKAYGLSSMVTCKGGEVKMLGKEKAGKDWIPKMNRDFGFEEVGLDGGERGFHVEGRDFCLARKEGWRKVMEDGNRFITVIFGSYKQTCYMYGAEI
ncbi:LOW QUALITY PROTEIN: E3 ubiquitin-protein ligase ATL6-like protein [Cinnamomum micranthum f. kanehirae]|uniref:RING-type E3 ubiquitin transferase n=1 Tax=Cinnamomum micranthum f. kanehirae TaxID=337451 RepID=A0A443P039_9MAGN|nr:LOW QUALITY PROTEIN: E3 ubiquitin-protein ligase ATL6-like protein [Cinnamomum micranthum f. kanehirae]